MSTPAEDLYRRIQSLPLSERLDLVSRIVADVKGNLQLRDELAEWDRLSDEALELFEKTNLKTSGFPGTLVIDPTDYSSTVRFQDR